MGDSQQNEIVTAFFPAQLAQRYRVVAALQGVSRSELLRRAANAYLVTLGYPMQPQQDQPQPARAAQQ